MIFEIFGIIEQKKQACSLVKKYVRSFVITLAFVSNAISGMIWSITTRRERE